MNESNHEKAPGEQASACGAYEEQLSTYVLGEWEALPPGGREALAQHLEGQRVRRA